MMYLYPCNICNTSNINVIFVMLYLEQRWQGHFLSPGPQTVYSLGVYLSNICNAVP